MAIGLDYYTNDQSSNAHHIYSKIGNHNGKSYDCNQQICQWLIYICCIVDNGVYFGKKLIDEGRISPHVIQTCSWSNKFYGMYYI